MEDKNIELKNEDIKKIVSAVPKFQTNITSAFQVVQKQFDTLNKVLEPVQQAFKKIQEVTANIAEFMKYHMLVPPQMFDSLRRMNIPLNKEEIKALKDESDDSGKQVYVIFTRKTKGNKIYNPKFFVNKETFDAIAVLMKRSGTSVSIDSPTIYFDSKSGALDVYGMVTYIKIDSDRYKLCKYMFGRRRNRTSWELEDLVNALNEREFSPKDKKKLYDWVNGKVIELNKDVENTIGIKDLISNEEGKFVLNGVNKL